MNAAVVKLRAAGCLISALALAGCGAGGGATNGAATNTASTNAASAPTARTAGGSTASSHPATEDGAKALLAEFVKPGADHAALSKNLRPSKDDYAAVFEPELAAKAEAVYGPAWDGGAMVIAPKSGQTEIKVFSATSDELKSWTGNAAEFPGGYKDVAAQLKPGVKIYRFKFVEPGQDLGMAYDGLVSVNGNWRIFPKPWRVAGS
jgi:hypothetical protein